MVLCGGEGDCVLPIQEGKERSFLACEELLDHDFPACRAGKKRQQVQGKVRVSSRVPKRQQMMMMMMMMMCVCASVYDRVCVCLCVCARVYDRV